MATTAITIEEYLNGPIPDPDVEYVDGELKGKSVVQSIHGRLQIIIGNWFEQHADEWGVVAGAEVRTQVSEGRVRLPDVVVATIGPWPPTLVEPPMIVIEILSPTDSFTELTVKLQDYERMGVQNVWVIDPQTRRAWASEGGLLIEKTHFQVPGSPIHLEIQSMFARYDKYYVARP